VENPLAFATWKGNQHMLTGWRGLLAGLALTLAVASAHADKRTDCASPDPDVSIRGCTAIIDAGAETAKNLAIAYTNRGLSYVKKGDFDRAISDNLKAIGFDPKNAEAYHISGLAFYGKGDFDRAIEAFDSSIIRDPKNATVYHNRGVALLKLDRLDRAILDLDRAIILDPKAVPSYLSRGTAFIKKGDAYRAIKDFERAIFLNPNDANAYNNRGGAYQIKGNLDRAIEDYSRAIVLNPADEDTHYNRGRAYAEKGDVNEAIKDFDRAIELSPKSAENFYARCWVRAVAGTDLKLARADCDAALSLVNEPHALSGRGLVGLKEGHFDKAWADYDAAVRAKPETAIYLYGRGIAASRLGRTAEGNADLAAAIKLDGKIAETYARYGVRP
jgi:tetratricopeptide (TPR) repeat protein